MRLLRPFILILALGLCAPEGRALGAESPQEKQARLRELRNREWVVTARFAASPLVVDGHLDEADWKVAEPIRDFYQRERNEGLKGSERTEVRVLYDRQNLYIGFTCYDRDMKRSLATILKT